MIICVIVNSEKISFSQKLKDAGMESFSRVGKGFSSLHLQMSVSVFPYFLPQSSVNTRFVDFGCRNPMRNPSAPPRGSLSINWHPAASASFNAVATSSTANAMWCMPPPFFSMNFAIVRLSHLEKCGFHFLVCHFLDGITFQPQYILIKRKSFLNAFYSNTDVFNVCRCHNVLFLMNKISIYLLIFKFFHQFKPTA